MKPLLHLTFLALTIIGSLNWGSVGIFDLDFVRYFFGYQTLLSKLVYSLVGLSGIYLLVYTLKRTS